ncbi:MAG: alpha/beta hydrolase [Acidimicrobiia bacterium]
MDAGRRYLETSALGAAATWNAYRPFSDHGLSSVFAYPAGFAPAEVPELAIAGTVLSALHYARRGALRTRAGRLGLGVSAANVAALVGLRRSAQHDGERLEAALVDGLGPGYDEGIPEPWIAPEDRRLPRSRYVVARDVPYGDRGKRQWLDVWRRPDLPPDARAPVLLQIPGGAFVVGSKNGQARPLLTHLSRQGWVCVAMNYRLSPRATWPDHIVDVKRVIAWIRANIGDHGGDPGFVAVTGGSAGGQLAAVAALSANHTPFQPGFEDVDTTVQAAVPLYGVYDIVDHEGTGRRDNIRYWERVIIKTRLSEDRANWELASPVNMARPDAPPFFVVHGTTDGLIRVEQARLFVRRLRAVATRPVCYAELPHAHHGFDFIASPRTRHTVAAVERFLLAAYACRTQAPTG